MQFTKIRLTNWRNFRSIEVDLKLRAFLIGPNASGKSNFLDAFRFLRDLAIQGGGLQSACNERGGITKIRCLAARNNPNIGIDVELTSNTGDQWHYAIEFTQETKFPHKGSAVLKREFASLNGEVLLNRPTAEDEQDTLLLTQTSLEQISRNKEFRALSDHFQSIAYLHLVPQMIRNPAGTLQNQLLPDMYGGNFLEKVAAVPDKQRQTRLRKIEDVLKLVVPQLEGLELSKDDRGIPHLEAVYKHWRPNAGKQDENQFSDGTLRLIGLLWALQEGNGLLLLEEPELSLHRAIVQQLAPFIAKFQKRRQTPYRQVFISTHSEDLLSDEGIAAEELLVFIPSENGTDISSGWQIEQIRTLMANGFTASDVAIPYTEQHSRIKQLSLFDL